MGNKWLGLVIALLPALCGAKSQFESVSEAFSPRTFEARRTALANAIPGSVVVLFGTKSLLDTWEEQRYNGRFRLENFRQDETLFYLSGFGAPSVVAVFDTGTKDLQFYAPAPTPQVESEVKRLALKPVKSLDAFETDVEKAIAGRPVYMLVRESSTGGPSGGFVVQGTAVGTYPRFLPGGAPGTYREDVIRQAFLQRFPKADVRSIIPVMRDIRKVLDAEEIAAIRKAVSITAEALANGLRTVAPGVDDIQVGAIMECTMRLNGSQIRAYAPDIQTGPNAGQWYTELFDQYDLANRTMQPGELALVDQGAEFSYYQADLARTAPVSGRFTPEQRTIYDVYLKVYEAGLAAMRPGASFNQAGEAASKVMLAEIPGLPEWLRPSALQFAQATKLGPPGHFLSTTLDLHRDAHLPLKAGQVMAYEIHWFIPEKGWRFTIEDDILITESGHEVLSQVLPRTAAGIEKLLASRNKVGCSAPAKPIAASR